MTAQANQHSIDVGRLEKKHVAAISAKEEELLAAGMQAKEERGRKRQEWADSAWHVVAADTTFKREAEALGIDSRSRVYG